MSKCEKNLLIAAIVSTIITIVGVIGMLIAPSNTSTLMRLCAFATMYGAMADIVVWRLYVEFKKENLLKNKESL